MVGKRQRTEKGRDRKVLESRQDQEISKGLHQSYNTAQNRDRSWLAEQYFENLILYINPLGMQILIWSV